MPSVMSSQPLYRTISITRLLDIKQVTHLIQKANITEELEHWLQLLLKMLWSEEEQQGPADLRRLRHGAVAVVPAGQPLGHRRDEGHAEVAHGGEVARGEGVVPHEGVHGRRDVDGLAVIPRAHHARQEVVAQPASDLGEGVGRERRDDQGVGPPAELDVEDLVADPPPAGPLVVVGVERDAAGEGGLVDEVQGGRGRHRADVGPLGDAAVEALELDGRHAAGGRQEDPRPPSLRALRRRRLLCGHRRAREVEKVGARKIGPHDETTPRTRRGARC